MESSRSSGRSRSRCDRSASVSGLARREAPPRQTREGAGPDGSGNERRSGGAISAPATSSADPSAGRAFSHANEGRSARTAPGRVEGKVDLGLVRLFRRSSSTGVARESKAVRCRAPPRKVLGISPRNRARRPPAYSGWRRFSVAAPPAAFRPRRDRRRPPGNLAAVDAVDCGSDRERVLREAEGEELLLEVHGPLERRVHRRQRVVHERPVPRRRKSSRIRRGFRRSLSRLRTGRRVEGVGT